jgi:hypothetical protein
MQDDLMSCDILVDKSAPGCRDQVERYYNFFIGVEVRLCHKQWSTSDCSPILCHIRIGGVDALYRFLHHVTADVEGGVALMA